MGLHAGYAYNVTTKRKKMLEKSMSPAVCNEVLKTVGPHGYSLLQKEINLRVGESFRTSPNGWVGDGSPGSGVTPRRERPLHSACRMEAKRVQSVYRVR